MTEKDVKTEIKTPDIMDEKDIDAAVNFINETVNETIYNGSIAIGKYILKHFFKGDVKLASSKNPRKSASFNKLYERIDLIIHPNKLALMVRVASQEQYLIDNSLETEGLSYTHKAALVKLDDTEKKIKIIKKCIEKKWSTRDLENEIKKINQGLLLDTKSSLIQTTKKYIAKVDDVLNTVEDSFFDIDDDELSKMAKDKRKKLEGYLNKLKTKIKDTVKKTDDISTGCDELLAKLTAVAEGKKANPSKRGRKPSKPTI